MSWYNPTSWSLGDVGNAVWQGATLGQGDRLSGLFSDPGADQENLRKAMLAQQAQAAGSFANYAQAGYGALGQQGNDALAQLQRYAQGQDSVSAEQLRQGLQQNIAAQSSAAAGAPPRQAAAAARTAMMMSGRLGAGLAGQQAIAGLQERQQAQQQYGQLLQGLRGQDLNAALGSRQTAVQGYGAGQQGAPEKSLIEKYGPAAQAALSAAATAASDRRLKIDIKDGDRDANRATAKLSPFKFAYKDTRHGEGEQLGVMAQDLEKAGLGHAVIDTPAGKMVHGAKLATSNTAMISALGRRLAKLERQGGK